MKNLCIHRAKHHLVMVILMRNRSRMQRKSTILMAVRRTHLLQKRNLEGITHIYARKIRYALPDLITEFTDLRNGRIEMHWGDMNTTRFHQVKEFLLPCQTLGYYFFYCAFKDIGHGLYSRETVFWGEDKMGLSMLSDKINYIWSLKWRRMSRTKCSLFLVIYAHTQNVMRKKLRRYV